jgi:hypothetical protein
MLNRMCTIIQAFIFKGCGSGAGRFAPMIRPIALLVLAASLFMLAACSEGDQEPKGPKTTTMTSTTATIGAHALVFQRIGGGLDRVKTPSLASSETGSTILVSVGRGQIAAFEAPTDNLNSVPYTQIDSAHRYANWNNSGTALYALENARGGAEHIVATRTPPEDEVTLAVVEVFGSRIEDVAWTEALLPNKFLRPDRWLSRQNTVTSASVETAGPATLVAFWWGDADVEGDKTAEPNNGFQVIEAVLEPGALVQCAVAVKHVSEAGRYDVSWTSSPPQGAQMWLVAVADE